MLRRYLVKMKHRVRDTIELLQRTTPDFTVQTCGHRTHQTLNPVYYRMPSDLSFSNVCMRPDRVHDIDELRQRLLHVWLGLEQLLIDDAVGQWQTRLREFEHTL